jgi:hypothetical protein
MKFFDYFTQGLQNTLKFKNRGGFSFRNEAIPVYTNTVIDTWYMGDFTSATYEVAVEYGQNDIERLTVIVSARVNQASITVYGRTNSGKDLVQFSASVNTSNVSLVVSPLYASDGVTALNGVYLTWTATYAERMVRLQTPTIIGESSNLGGETGVTDNWTNNLGTGFLQVNDAGSITVSSISNVAVTGTTTVSAGFILDQLNLANTDGNISIGLAPLTNTLTISVIAIQNLIVTGSVISQAAGLCDNVTIGSNTPQSGTVSQLSITKATSLSNNNSTVSLSPTLTGRVIINPSTCGTINNMAIGSLVPKDASFSTLALTRAPVNNAQLVTLASIQPRLLLGAI